MSTCREAPPSLLPRVYITPLITQSSEHVVWRSPSSRRRFSNVAGTYNNILPSIVREARPKISQPTVYSLLIFIEGAFILLVALFDCY